MNPYKIQSVEFYTHFSQYDTWLETLVHLLEAPHLKRKKAKGRDFFKNVANDIVDGMQVSKRCAASLLQDLSAAHIQPPQSYDGGAIVMMPADMELLNALTKDDKTTLKKRIAYTMRYRRNHETIAPVSDITNGRHNYARFQITFGNLALCRLHFVVF